MCHSKRRDTLGSTQIFFFCDSDLHQLPPTCPYCCRIAQGTVKTTVLSAQWWSVKMRWCTVCGDVVILHRAAAQQLQWMFNRCLNVCFSTFISLCYVPCSLAKSSNFKGEVRKDMSFLPSSLHSGHYQLTHKLLLLKLSQNTKPRSCYQAHSWCSAAEHRRHTAFRVWPELHVLN